jgi:hypothetical protein
MKRKPVNGDQSIKMSRKTMNQPKSLTVGVGIAGTAALIFLIIALINFPLRPQSIFGEFKEVRDTLTFAQLVVSFFGFIGAISAFTLAIVQYRKSAKWKRMEYIADEVKEFESDPTVQNALLMIDWGKRKINLHLVSQPQDKDLIKITRDDQWKALLPHPLKYEFPGYQSSVRRHGESQSERIANVDKDFAFTVTEAKIRDTYDVFLTRLDRFWTFIKSDLIDEKELRPFIDYWIDSLTSTDDLQKDAAWRGALLTYINFYKYTGVKELFNAYGKDLDPDGKVYQEVLKRIQDKTLADRLYKSVSANNKIIAANTPK